MKERLRNRLTTFVDALEVMFAGNAITKKDLAMIIV
jgi:hypothetical protein